MLAKADGLAKAEAKLDACEWFGKGESTEK